MDVADQADEQAQAHFNARIAEIRREARVSIEGDGTCEVCGMDVEPVNFNGRLIIPRWCCTECRDRADL